MDCRDIKKLLLDYIEGDLSKEATQKVQAHLHKCKSCSKESAKMQKMVNLMKTIPASTPNPGISEEVMTKLEEEERVTLRSLVAKLNFPPKYKKIMIAAATLMVLAFGLFASMDLWFHQPPLQFQSWAATIQAVPFDLEDTGWWAWRKRAADERILPEDKYIGVIFGGFLAQPEEVSLLVKWIKPDGELFKETLWKGSISAGLCSFMSDLYIRDREKREIMEPLLTSSFEGEVISRKKEGRVVDCPGMWRLEIYVGGKLNTTLQFEV